MVVGCHRALQVVETVVRPSVIGGHGPVQSEAPGLTGVELDGVGAVTEAVVAVDVVVFGAPL